MKFPKNIFKNNINPSVIKGAVIGVILTFFLSKIFDPICEVIYTGILAIGDFFLSSCSNATYKAIAKGLSEQASYVLLYIVFTGLIILLTYMYLDFKNLCKNAIKELDTQEQKLNLLDRSKPVSNTVSEEATEETKIVALKEQISKDKKSIKNSQLVVYPILCFSFALICLLYGRQVFIREKVVSAVNGMEILAPYISDQQYKHLKSDFHLIQNKQDYDSLLRTLDNIAFNNNVELPK